MFFFLVLHSFFTVLLYSGKLTLSGLEAEHTRKRSGDELKAVERPSPVLVLFVRVNNRDAQGQQHLYRHLTNTSAKPFTVKKLSRTFRVMDFIAPTFITLNALQLHGFRLHFLLSSGFMELSRM